MAEIAESKEWTERTEMAERKERTERIGETERVESAEDKIVRGPEMVVKSSKVISTKSVGSSR